MGNRADELIHQGMTFLFAFEVEIGYLVGDISLDKDGVRCAAMFYELAAQLHSQGKSCMGRVEELEKELGASFMLNQYCICNDPRVFEAIFSRIRTMGPQGGVPHICGGLQRDVSQGCAAGPRQSACRWEESTAACDGQLHDHTAAGRGGEYHTEEQRDGAEAQVLRGGVRCHAGTGKGGVRGDQSTLYAGAAAARQARTHITEVSDTQSPAHLRDLLSLPHPRQSVAVHRTGMEGFGGRW